MTSQRPKIIQHQNDLRGYIGNWCMIMNHVFKVQPPIDIPQELVSLGDNTHDLSVMLSYLDVKLKILEETPFITGQQFDYQAYSEAKSFLKVCYLLVRILFDDVAGIIEYFYKKNDPKVYRRVKKGFARLLDKAIKRELPEDLSTMLGQTIVHFPKLRNRRVDVDTHGQSPWHFTVQASLDLNPVVLAI